MRIGFLVLLLCGVSLAEPAFPPVKSSTAAMVKFDEQGHMVHRAETAQPVQLRPYRRSSQPRFHPVHANPWWYYMQPGWCPPVSDPTWRRFNYYDPWCAGRPYLYP